MTKDRPESALNRKGDVFIEIDRPSAILNE
ncbi:unknow (plasmid) [Vibrio campbellii]|uniref:Unknow n=1 Tax=Vibrio campbellii TaxID=680 RepID=A0AAC9SP61_9VIBR|nr:unknow [Vibrio campbellii]